ncbi:uncharacterized protein LOC112044325 [Bicyclus anynana]|uniref:Uncharacterized protein LOC112044325 n=1 Tax=Bicyclus anynana TaxID=110368 RepID=A0A6J1MK91_BICAN|nr:uncharacterized protein LOC112044325 [Bicyclus anynana]
MKTIFLLLALALCARSEDVNKPSQAVETQKDKRQTEEGTPQLVYRTARKQEQVAPVEENQEDDKGQRGGSEEYRPGQVYSLNVQELLELQPERKAPLGSSQQLQQLYTNPQQEHRQNLQQVYYLEPQVSRQFALQPSHTVIARPHYSSYGGEASVGAALSVSDTGASSSEGLDQELLALLGHQIRQEDTRPQTFTQQAPQQAQSVASQYQPVDVPYVPKPSKKPLKLRSKVQTAPTPTSAPQQYLIETTNVQQQHQPLQFRPIPQNQRVPQTLRYVPIQQAQAAVQQPLYERPESQGLKVVPAPKLQQLNPQYNYRIQYQQEASPKQYRLIDTPRPQPVRQEARVLSNERPVTYLKRFPEPEKVRVVPTEQSIHEGLSSVQRPVQLNDQYYLRPVYRTNDQRARYELPAATLRPMEQARSFDTVKTPLSSIYVSKNIVPKKVARPVVRYEQVPRLEQPLREPYRIEQASTDQVNVEQHTQSVEEQRSHLPPPKNSKAYTPEEFAALVAAGYSVTPIPVTQAGTQVAQSRASSEPIAVQQRRLYSRRHQYLPLRGDDAP